MNIDKFVKSRGIRRILHFTTNQGLLGILDSGMVKSRNRLRSDERLAYILKLNTKRVYDPEWKDYVNLSISRINTSFFNFSKKSHRPDVKWRVLSFLPEILLHENVFFCTTNNIYPSVLRGQGLDGLKAIFSEVVLGYYSQPVRRDQQANLNESCPTCIQAEVLYPKMLSTEYLECIFVKEDCDQDDVFAQFGAVQHPEIPVITQPNIFQGEIA